MSDPNFGHRLGADGSVVHTVQPDREIIFHALAKLEKQMSSTASQLVLRERYETAFGIFNHESPQGMADPFGAVGMRWSENSATGSLLYERIKQFREAQIPKHFGYNFTEWLELPRDVCMEILEQANEAVKQEAKFLTQITLPNGKPTP